MSKSIEIYKSRIDKVTNYVRDNLDKPISLNELASVSFFSPYHFHRIFTAVTGETVKSFTNRTRLEKAARLLKLSNNSISGIAFECGYSSPSALSRAFNQYFGLSPSSYRKNGKIKNSKICKELFPIDQYHCQMNETELRTNFPVKIKELPKRRIAYIRVSDSFKEGVVLNAFKDLITWSKKRNLFHTAVIFGMSMDDPLITPKDKYNYEVCITIPEDFIIDYDDQIETMDLPKCKYAITSVSGDFNKAATATNYLFNNWLINSAYEPEHQPGLEIFLDKENICNWNHFDLDLCIPIKKIQSF